MYWHKDRADCPETDMKEGIAPAQKNENYLMVS